MHKKNRFTLGFDDKYLENVYLLDKRDQTGYTIKLTIGIHYAFCKRVRIEYFQGESLFSKLRFYLRYIFIDLNIFYRIYHQCINIKLE